MRSIKIMFVTLIISVSGSQSYGWQSDRPNALGILEGKVTDGKGNSLAGMRVFALTSAFKREATTDIEGKYRLDLPHGNYVIRAGTDCNQTFQKRDVTISVSKTRTLDITIPLFHSYAANVSIYQLLATPEKYHDRPVRISGYYQNGFELSAMFASKDDADYLIGKNSLWITFGDGLRLEADHPKLKLSSDDVGYFNGKYVLIEGIFKKNSCGHMGMSSGEIRNVTRIVELKRYFDVKRIG